MGWCLSFLAGLVIRGDGANRGGGADEVGTTIVFDLQFPGEPPVPFPIGIGIKGCSALRFENLTIQGAPSATSTHVSIGVGIETLDGASTTGIQFQNVTFRWCAIAVQTANTNNNSELAFYDCLFNANHIGFQCLNDQALVHKFIGCVGGGDAGPDLIGEDPNPWQGMETMFDLTSGGNITVIGFGGQNIETLVKVGNGGGNIGWNLFHNVRLEQFGDDNLSTWGNTHRTKLYLAVMSSGEGHGQNTEFNGVVITPPGMGDIFEGGITRFSLLRGHNVVLKNASRTPTSQFATVDAMLLDFPTVGGSDRGGTLLVYNASVPFDARLDRDDVPSDGCYFFENCNEDALPYPDRLHPPLYGPNYLMSVEYHCWTVDDGLNGVQAFKSGSGSSVGNVAPSDEFRAGVIQCYTEGTGWATLMSYPECIRPGASEWWFQASVRVTADYVTESTEYRVCLGFGDSESDQPDNGPYFRFFNTDTNWMAVLAWNGSRDVVDTGIPKDEDWHTFEIVTIGGGSGAEFYIDGEHVATASQSYDFGEPTGLLPLQFRRLAAEAEGLAAEIDYYKYQIRPATPSPMYPQ